MKNPFSRLQDSHSGPSKPSAKDSYKFWLPQSRNDREVDQTRVAPERSEILLDPSSSRRTSDKRGPSRTHRPSRVVDGHASDFPTSSIAYPPANHISRHPQLSSVAPSYTYPRSSSRTQVSRLPDFLIPGDQVLQPALLQPVPSLAPTSRAIEHDRPNDDTKPPARGTSKYMARDHNQHRGYHSDYPQQRNDKSRKGEKDQDFNVRATLRPNEDGRLQRESRREREATRERDRERAKDSELDRYFDIQKEREQENEKERERYKRERERAAERERERKEREMQQELEQEKLHQLNREREWREKERELEREKEKREREQAREKEKIRERERREKERERRERDLEKQKERERERRDRELELERQKGLERERERERLRKDKETLLERQKEAERERERQRREKGVEMEQAKEREQREVEVEKEKEEERQRREVEMEKQKEWEQERDRQQQEKELQLQRQKEAERERQRREKESEMERERQRREMEMEEQKEREQERDRQRKEKELERELEREKEHERQRREMEREKEKERERQRREAQIEVEREKERVRREKELERQKEREQERERQRRERELERQKEVEREKEHERQRREMEVERERERQRQEMELEVERDKERVRREKELESEREKERVRREKELELERERERDRERQRRERELERQREVERQRREKEQERERERRELERQKEKEQERHRQRRDKELQLERQKEVVREREREHQRKEMEMEMEKEKDKERERREKERERTEKEREAQSEREREQQRERVLRLEKEKEKETEMERERERSHKERELACDTGQDQGRGGAEIEREIDGQRGHDSGAVYDRHYQRPRGKESKGREDVTEVGEIQRNRPRNEVWNPTSQRSLMQEPNDAKMLDTEQHFQRRPQWSIEHDQDRNKALQPRGQAGMVQEPQRDSPKNPKSYMTSLEVHKQHDPMNTTKRSPGYRNPQILHNLPDAITNTPVPDEMVLPVPSHKQHRSEDATLLPSTVPADGTWNVSTVMQGVAQPRSFPVPPEELHPVPNPTPMVMRVYLPKEGKISASQDNQNEFSPSDIDRVVRPENRYHKKNAEQFPANEVAEVLMEPTTSGQMIRPPSRMASSIGHQAPVIHHQASALEFKNTSPLNSRRDSAQMLPNTANSSPALPLTSFAKHSPSFYRREESFRRDNFEIDRSPSKTILGVKESPGSAPPTRLSPRNTVNKHAEQPEQRLPAEAPVMPPISHIPTATSKVQLPVRSGQEGYQVHPEVNNNPSSSGPIVLDLESPAEGHTAQKLNINAGPSFKDVAADYRRNDRVAAMRQPQAESEPVHAAASRFSTLGGNFKESENFASIHLSGPAILQNENSLFNRTMQFVAPEKPSVAPTPPFHEAQGSQAIIKDTEKVGLDQANQPLSYIRHDQGNLNNLNSLSRSISQLPTTNASSTHNLTNPEHEGFPIFARHAETFPQVLPSVLQDRNLLAPSLKSSPTNLGSAPPPKSTFASNPLPTYQQKLVDVKDARPALRQSYTVPVTLLTGSSSKGDAHLYPEVGRTQTNSRDLPVMIGASLETNKASLIPGRTEAHQVVVPVTAFMYSGESRQEAQLPYGNPKDTFDSNPGGNIELSSSHKAEKNQHQSSSVAANLASVKPMSQDTTAGPDLSLSRIEPHPQFGLSISRPPTVTGFRQAGNRGQDISQLGFKDITASSLPDPASTEGGYRAFPILLEAQQVSVPTTILPGYDAKVQPLGNQSSREQSQLTAEVARPFITHSNIDSRRDHSWMYGPRVLEITPTTEPERGPIRESDNSPNRGLGNLAPKLMDPGRTASAQERTKAQGTHQHSVFATVNKPLEFITDPPESSLLQPSPLPTSTAALISTIKATQWPIQSLNQSVQRSKNSLDSQDSPAKEDSPPIVLLNDEPLGQQGEVIHRTEGMGLPEVALPRPLESQIRSRIPAEQKAMNDFALSAANRGAVGPIVQKADIRSNSQAQQTTSMIYHERLAKVLSSPSPWKGDLSRGLPSAELSVQRFSTSGLRSHIDQFHTSEKAQDNLGISTKAQEITTDPRTSNGNQLFSSKVDQDSFGRQPPSSAALNLPTVNRPLQAPTSESLLSYTKSRDAPISITNALSKSDTPSLQATTTVKHSSASASINNAYNTPRPHHRNMYNSSASTQIPTNFRESNAFALAKKEAEVERSQKLAAGYTRSASASTSNQWSRNEQFQQMRNRHESSQRLPQTPSTQPRLELPSSSANTGAFHQPFSHHKHSLSLPSSSGLLASSLEPYLRSGRQTPGPPRNASIPPVATSTTHHAFSSSREIIHRVPSDETILMTPSSLAPSMLKPSQSQQTNQAHENSKYAIWHPSSTKEPDQAESRRHAEPQPDIRNTSTLQHRTNPPPPISIPSNTFSRENEDPRSRVFTPFRTYLTSRRKRTMSIASLEAQDGTTAANTVVGSPTASTHSQVPLQLPPVRDPIVAAQEWRNREEAELQATSKVRRQRPGVVFDVEEDPSEERVQRLRRTRMRVSGRQADSTR